MKTSNKITKIIISYLKGKTTFKDKIILDKWLDSDRKNRQFFNKINDENYIKELISDYNKNSVDLSWEDLSRKLKLNYKNSIKSNKQLQINTIKSNLNNKFIRNFYKYAAFIIIFISIIGLSGYLISNLSEDKIVEGVQIAKIQPGTYKAKLISSNGLEYNLTANSDTVLMFNNQKVRVDSSCTLIYDKKDSTNNLNIHSMMNTLVIPRGGEYKLELCDGTIIHMNSESEIKYPSVFVGNKREVYLKGEAYFEVAKNTEKPFIVHATDMNVRVLGTFFDISSYKDEIFSTTLVKGSVELFNNKSNKILARLVPNQRFTSSNNGYDVQNVDTQPYTSWKEGRFVFVSQTLDEVIAKLSRWYDIDFFFANQSIKEKKFTGNIPKFQNINKVLEMLEYTSRIKFTINKKTIIIMGE